MKWKTFLFQIIKMSFYSRIKPTQNTNNICRIFFKIAENMLYNSTLHLIVFWITLKRMNHLVWQTDYKPFAFQFFFPSEILIITSLYQICFLPRETQDSQVKTFDDKMERHKPQFILFKKTLIYQNNQTNRQCQFKSNKTAKIESLPVSST